MSYSVKLDGNDILDYDDQSLVLLEPSLEDEVNDVGSFEFRMPPIHQYYGEVKPLISTVEVYQDDDLLWYGRVLSVSTDYYREKAITCEGPFGWFHDSIQEENEYENISLHTFFTLVVLNHNSQVPESRRFTVGTITVDDETVYRKLDYQDTKSVLEDMCLDTNGGYLIFRKENGQNYIDWVKEMPYTCNQPVEFGLNMTDISSSFEAGDIITSVWPLGYTIQENGDPSKGPIVPADDPRIGHRLTLRDEYGIDIIDSTLTEIYGRITEVVTFDNVKTPEVLLEKGTEYLQKQLYDRMTFECTAVELKNYGPGANDNYDHFKIGQTVRVRSKPHAIDQEFPLTKLSIRLDTAVKEITLGTLPHKTLTQIVNTNTEDAKK